MNLNIISFLILTSIKKNSLSQVLKEKEIFITLTDTQQINIKQDSPNQSLILFLHIFAFNPIHDNNKWKTSVKNILYLTILANYIVNNKKKTNKLKKATHAQQNNEINV